MNVGPDELGGVVADDALHAAHVDASGRGVRADQAAGEEVPPPSVAALARGHTGARGACRAALAQCQARPLAVKRQGWARPAAPPPQWGGSRSHPTGTGEQHEAPTAPETLARGRGQWAGAAPNLPFTATARLSPPHSLNSCGSPPPLPREPLTAAASPAQTPSGSASSRLGSGGTRTRPLPRRQRLGPAGTACGEGAEWGVCQPAKAETARPCP